MIVILLTPEIFEKERNVFVKNCMVAYHRIMYMVLCGSVILVRIFPDCCRASFDYYFLPYTWNYAINHISVDKKLGIRNPVSSL